MCVLCISACILRDVYRVKRSCFNCGGDHELNACNERRNVQRISENRQQFQQRKLSAGIVPQGKQTRSVYCCLTVQSASVFK